MDLFQRLSTFGFANRLVALNDRHETFCCLVSYLVNTPPARHFHHNHRYRCHHHPLLIAKIYTRRQQHSLKTTDLFLLEFLSRPQSSDICIFLFHGWRNTMKCCLEENHDSQIVHCCGNILRPIISVSHLYSLEI